MKMNTDFTGKLFGPVREDSIHFSEQTREHLAGLERQEHWDSAHKLIESLNAWKCTF